METYIIAIIVVVFVLLLVSSITGGVLYSKKKTETDKAATDKKAADAKLIVEKTAADKKIADQAVLDAKTTSEKLSAEKVALDAKIILDKAIMDKAVADQAVIDAKAAIKQRQDITKIDRGYPNGHIQGKELIKGWYDVQNQGVQNDYCRYIGNNPAATWSCALAGGGEKTMDESLPIFKKLTSYDQGYPDGRKYKKGWYDIDGSGFASNFCRYVGNPPNEVWSCAPMGDTSVLTKTNDNDNLFTLYIQPTVTTTVTTTGGLIPISLMVTTVTGCEGDGKTLSAPTGMIIKSGTITYGRWEQGNCQGSVPNPIIKKTYPLKSAIGKQSYKIGSLNQECGEDPAPGIYKQYSITYYFGKNDTVLNETSGVNLY